MAFSSLSSHDSAGHFVSAFSFSDLTSKQIDRARSSSALGLATTTTTSVKEEDAIYLLNKAREFAFSDEFGGERNDNLKEYDQHYHALGDELSEIEESKRWLREIINVQSGCAAGTLSGKDLCENQDEAAEIVARLRRKIEIHEKRVAARTKESESLVPTIATDLIVAAIVIVVVMFWTTLDLGQRHDDIPSMENYQVWAKILEEKEYLTSLLQGGKAM